MNKITKIHLIPIIIISLFIISNTTIYAKFNNNYIPSKFAIIPCVSLGYFESDYNCDVKLFDGKNKLEAKAISSYFTINDKDTFFLMDYSYTIGAKFEIGIFRNLILTPEIEFQQNKIRSYKFNDNNIINDELSELNIGHSSRYINLPIMFNFYFSNGGIIGIGPKIHYNITKEKNQIFSINPYFISGAVSIGVISGDESKGRASIISIVADRTITNIYKDEDVINKNKISSIWSNNLRIALMFGYKFSIIK